MSVAQHTAAELVHDIFDLQRALRGVSAAGMRHADLGPAHTGVLFFIGEGSPLRASALAARLGIGPSALSRQLADLEQFGLLVREQDPQDGRACLLTLSDAGRQYLHQTYERRAETLREILADWTETEAEAASSSVRHLTAALRSATVHDVGATAPHTPTETGNDGRHHHLDTSSEITKEAR